MISPLKIIKKFSLRQIFIGAFLIANPAIVNSQIIRSNILYYEGSIVDEGKSLDSIFIFRTTLHQISKVYGKGKLRKHKERHEAKRGYFTNKWVEVVYEDKGLKFVAGGWKRIISKIDISLPFEASTRKGIILGQSQKNQILQLYGTPAERENVKKGSNKFDYYCCDSVYRYPAYGIDFIIDCDTASKS